MSRSTEDVGPVYSARARPAARQDNESGALWRACATSSCSVGSLLEARASVALQAAQMNDVNTDDSPLASTVGVATVRLGGQAQALPELRLDAVEELVHAREKALVFEHQRVTDHDPRHARVLLAELQQHRRDPLDLRPAVRLALDDLIDEAEDGPLDEFDQAFEHLRLAREVAVQRGLVNLELGRQARRS